MKNKTLLVAILLLLFTGLASIPIRNAIKAAKECDCRGHMNQLQRALREYEETHGNFPQAFIKGPDGKPWHSWRVLLLPYIGEQEVYDKYNFEEPWNGVNNRKLADEISVRYYQCPNGHEFENTFMTNYVVMTGKDTVFPGDQVVSKDQLSDGAENTILLVEIDNSDIHWMEPRDLKFDQLESSYNGPLYASNIISSQDPVGPGVIFADQITCYRIDEPFKTKYLKSLLTISNGETPKKEDFINRFRYLSDPAIAP